MGGLWKGETEEERDRRKGKRMGGGHLLLPKRKKERKLSKKDRKIKSRKIKRGRTEYTQMGNRLKYTKTASLIISYKQTGHDFIFLVRKQFQAEVQLRDI